MSLVFEQRLATTVALAKFLVNEAAFHRDACPYLETLMHIPTVKKMTVALSDADLGVMGRQGVRRGVLR